jgi:DNA-directed RNA polymerase subunit RPC12/RpoP
MKKPYYIDFPQEHIEGQMHKYRCAHCKVETTTINGTLEGHLPTCAYRMKLEHTGYEATGCAVQPASSVADDED